ncbi:MAG: HAMP domain-containing sensor histidine kinase [Bacteroidales bacterium]
MNIYTQKQLWKTTLFIVAVLIGVGSLWYTNQLVKQLAESETKKVKLWADATIKITDPSTAGTDIEFLMEVLANNTTVPVILTDNNRQIVSFRNLDSLKSMENNYLEQQLALMKKQHQPIAFDIGGGEKNYIYYKNSSILYQLTYYPYIQLGVIMLFIFVSYLAFSVSRNAEQNKVWVGLSKETAHQLGTPTSSLLAWVELLKSRGTDENLTKELEKDVQRLSKITERFSKIGSRPNLKPENLPELIERSISYLRTRVSDEVEIRFIFIRSDLIVPLSAALFEWVIENVCKNAVDALEGKGKIDIQLFVSGPWAILDIQDNGKGIPRGMHKTIFKPGYTTKERGWGLGLSLSKRIIESYHNGRIFVLNSESGKGTCIRIMLKKD